MAHGPQRQSPHALFAVTAPGLAPLCAAELRGGELRSVAAAARPEPGGVAFRGGYDAARLANLWLRTASRVLVRVAEFTATAFFELERRARKVAWEEYVAPGRAVDFRVTCRQSRLYHSGAVAQRLLEAVSHRVGALGVVPETAARLDARGDGGGDAAAGDEVDAGVGAQLFVARLVRDRLTVSVDSSGALLHRRGYRLAVAKAPLRETIAAAMLLGSEWDPRAPLVDPLCGAGTIAVEAALLARRMAPGLVHSPGEAARRFAFMDWPSFDARAWDEDVARARELALPAAPAPIVASDRDRGAVEAARGNAERAGVAADVSLDVRALSAVEPPRGRGWIVTNPPYGERIGGRDRVRDLYAQLGTVPRRRFDGWTLALLSPDPRLDRQVALPLTEALRTSNGGIPVRLMVGQVARSTPVRRRAGRAAGGSAPTTGT